MSAAMAPERWRRIRPLLDRALDLDTDARAAFLREVSTESMDLRADLDRLLAHHLEDAALDQPAAAMVAPDLELTQVAVDAPRAAPFIGKRAGAFRLTRLIGAGGMGAVYEGERVDGGFRQSVAVKLVAGIHPGLTARFERERQILADLRHPHIAQLLDGGETEDGIPYFALEYVDGLPITQYADSIDADIDGRVRLLIEVAEALAYAHRRQVIHRDIKPNNVLVSADGHVKLLDFGIAKLLKSETGLTLTKQGIGPMTPEYAAPEQFRGSALGPATDIYQFGVLMFRLLSGQLPYQADADDSYAWAKAVSEEEPLSLNTVLRRTRRDLGEARQSAETWRRIDPRRLGGLERILRRALAKNPADRPASMDALIAELEEFSRSAHGPAPAPRWHRRYAYWIGAALAAALVAALLPWIRPALDRHTEAAGAADLQHESVLRAFGLQPENLHTSDDASRVLLLQALRHEAQGEAPTAMALLETLHASDPQTPLPAMLLGYWSSNLSSRGQFLHWREQAQQRLGALNDPYLQLLQRYMIADTDGDFDEALRLSGALLDLRPKAWFLRMARAHMFIFRGLRAAGLAELQKIEVDSIDHRKLIDALADRASLGDLPGARAQFERLQLPADDPKAAALAARLAYTGGDLRAARDFNIQAVTASQRVARFDIEGRAMLWAGVYSGALGDYAAARLWLHQARSRLAARSQFRFAADAALALAQISALEGDADGVRREVASAREITTQIATDRPRVLLALQSSRLLGEPPVTEDGEVGLSGAEGELLRARAAVQRGDLESARAALLRAEGADVYSGHFQEEAALLAQELGLPVPQLQPIDPPFGPYARYAARWALGQGDSIVPRPQASTAQ